MTKPIERSIPPLTITKVSPLANNRSVVAARRILEKFLKPKKFFPKMLNRPSINIKKSRDQFLPMRPSALLFFALDMPEEKEPLDTITEDFLLWLE